MKLSIRQAVAAAMLLGAAASAYAINPGDVPANNRLYVSGATSTDSAMQTVFTTNDPVGICDPVAGTIDIYANAGSAANKGFAVLCMAKGSLNLDGTGNPAPIAIVKESNVGSTNGQAPIGASSNLTFIDIFAENGTAPTCAVSTPTPPTDQNTATQHACSVTPGVTKVSTLGVSDVEAAVFKNDEATLGISQNPGFDVIWGPAVSLGLYRALQSAQGLTADDTLANMPSVSSAQLSALYNGKIATLANLTNAAGTGLNGITVTFGDGATTTASSPGPFLCRRDNGSGTQKSFEIYFTGQNCGSTAVLPFRTATAAPGAACMAAGCSWDTATYINAPVFPGGSTGDVLACMHAHDAAHHFALGIASVENAWGPAQSNAARQNWRFVRLDGIVPSVEETARGNYNFFAQNILYTKTGSAPAATAGGALQTYIVGNMGRPATLASLNKRFVWTAPAFDGGFLAIPSTSTSTGNQPAVPPNNTLTDIRANPTNTLGKFLVNNTTTNNCQTPVQRSGQKVQVAF